MSSRYVSFVVRMLVGDDGKMASGRVYRVPEQEGRYFHTWEELVALLKALLSNGKESAGESSSDKN